MSAAQGVWAFQGTGGGTTGDHTSSRERERGGEQEPEGHTTEDPSSMREVGLETTAEGRQHGLGADLKTAPGGEGEMTTEEYKGLRAMLKAPVRGA